MFIKTKEEFNCLNRFRQLVIIYRILKREEDKERLVKNSLVLLTRLKDMGYSQDWLDGILFGGKDFFKEVYGDGQEEAGYWDTLLILG